MFVVFLLFIPSPLVDFAFIQNEPCILHAFVEPTKVQCNTTMGISAVVTDFFGIQNVQVKNHHENGYDLVDLQLISGTKYSGTWKGTWIVHDTLFKEYHSTITAYSITGYSTSVNVSWVDPPSWWNIDFKYRKQINITEPQGLSRTKTHVLFSIDLEQNRLSDENGTALVYNDVQIPFDAYAITKENGWITQLEGLAELDISADEMVNCYLYYDPVFSATEILPITTGWSYVAATGYSGQNYVDLSPIDIDCYGEDTDGQYTTICGASDNIKLNEWCYFKAPQTTNFYFKTGSDDGSGLWLDNVLIVTDNNGGHSVRWRDSSARSLTNGRYYAIEIDWAEQTGSQALNNRWDTAPGDNSNGNIIDTEGYPFYGDEWLLEVTISNIEEVADPSQPLLFQPLNNTNTNDNTPTFVWTIGNNTEFITLLVDNETDLSDGDEWVNISFDSSTLSYTLSGGESLSDGKWYWQVIANNSHAQNASEIRTIIIDTTPPFMVYLDQPIPAATLNDNQVLFSWDATDDNTTYTPYVSQIACYQLQVDNDQDFSSPLISENTSDNATLSLSKQIAGKLYWRVRAWDQAGNAGSFSSTRTLTVFGFSLTASSSSVTVLRGNTGSTILQITTTFGEPETINLSSEWDDITPSGVTVDISNTSGTGTFSSTLLFTTAGDASTGEFLFTINAASSTGNNSIVITVRIAGMIFKTSASPTSFVLTRSDSDQSRVSVTFQYGAKESVSLSGQWVGTTPSGVTVTYSTVVGTPPFDSILLISTSNQASSGSYTYKVTATGGGINDWIYITIDINTALTLTLQTDKSAYEKGQEIEISGTVLDPRGDDVEDGLTFLTFSTDTWYETIELPIVNGQFNTEYYITFDKFDGDWILSATAVDDFGHETLEPINITVYVSIPAVYKSYSVMILSPLPGQVFRRGDIISFTVSVSENESKVRGATVSVRPPGGDHGILSEISPGTYSMIYTIEVSSPIGNWSVYIEGSTGENELFKAGFGYVQISVEPTELSLEILEPIGKSFETGEEITVITKLLYPDGSPVEDGVVVGLKTDGSKLEFKKTGIGLYSTTYTATSEDLGYWSIQVSATDVFGNVGVIKRMSVEVISVQLPTYFVRFWWLTGLLLFGLCSALGYVSRDVFRSFRMKYIERESLELNRLKIDKAKEYFLKGSISRETYDNLLNDYESKLAKLDKQKRILQKKMVRKNKLVYYLHKKN